MCSHASHPQWPWPGSHKGQQQNTHVSSTGSGQQAQLHALANARWKPNTHLYFKPHFPFVFWNHCLTKTVVSAWLKAGLWYGQPYLNSKEHESIGWARWAKNWLYKKLNTQQEQKIQTLYLTTENSVLFHASSHLNSSQLFSMKELGRHTAWQGKLSTTHFEINI